MRSTENDEVLVSFTYRKTDKSNCTNKDNEFIQVSPEISVHKS